MQNVSSTIQLPIISSLSPENSMSQVSSTTTPELSSETVSAKREERQPSIVLQTAADYMSITREHVYRQAPPFIRNIPTYIINDLAQMDQNSDSSHQTRDAVIGVVADEVVEGLLGRLIGATPAGIAIMVGNLAAEPLRSTLPSIEQIEQNLGSDDRFKARFAERQIQAKVLVDILALPATAANVISRLARRGFDHFTQPDSSSHSLSCSGSLSSSSSSLTSSLSSSSFSTLSSTEVPAFDELFTLGRQQEEANMWEIIRVKVIQQIGLFSPFVPSSSSTVTSSSFPTITTDTFSTSSSLSIIMPEESVEEQIVDQSHEKDHKEAEWTGVQIHIPLDNIKNIQISTGVQFKGGQYQTGISTTLRHPVKDLHVSGSIQGDSIGGGLDTSLRDPVRNLHGSIFIGDLSIRTSFRHPAKDITIMVPIVPLVGLSIPLKKISQSRVTVGIPFIPGASASIPVKKIEKVVKEVVVEPIKAIGKPVEHVVKEVAQPVGKVAERVVRNVVRQPLRSVGRVFKKMF